MRRHVMMKDANKFVLIGKQLCGGDPRKLQAFLDQFKEFFVEVGLQQESGDDVDGLAPMAKEAAAP